MPVYVWKGRNQYGEKRKGEVDAPDQAAVDALNFHLPRCFGRLRFGDSGGNL